MRLRFAAVILTALSILAAGPVGAGETIVLASTTSVENSGLLAHILPEFTSKTGISARVLAQGTGQALATAARGDADLVLVHDPEAEQQFIAEGHGAGRRQIAWNDFIVVGPRADPAHIAGGQNAVAAFTAIAKAGAPFVSPFAFEGGGTGRGLLIRQQALMMYRLEKTSGRFIPIRMVP